MKGDFSESLATPQVEATDDRPPRVYVSPGDTRTHAWWFLFIIIATAVALYTAFSQFGCNREGKCGITCPEQGLLFTIAILSGALGGLIHTATSFAEFAGNRRLFRGWLIWFYLRPAIGASLAALVYVAFRAGVLGNGGKVVDTCSDIYLLSLAAGIAGLFSKQATDRLRDLVDNLLTPAKPPARQDPAQPESAGGVAGDAAAAPGAQPKPRFEETIREVQKLLIAGGFLGATSASGSAADDGILGDETRAAVEAFLRSAHVEGEAREATIGDETTPDFWTNLRDLLEQSAKRSGG